MIQESISQQLEFCDFKLLGPICILKVFSNMHLGKNLSLILLKIRCVLTFPSGINVWATMILSLVNLA